MLMSQAGEGLPRDDSGPDHTAVRSHGLFGPHIWALEAII